MAHMGNREYSPLWHRAPVSTQTTIPCKHCGAPLKAERTCHEAMLICAECHARAPVSVYSDVMDTALEAFLDALPCDRI